MSNPVKDEEQLLQDASTLLMFANVAAKQQQQHLVQSPNSLASSAPPPPPPSVVNETLQPLGVRSPGSNVSTLLNPVAAEPISKPLAYPKLNSVTVPPVSSIPQFPPYQTVPLTQPQYRYYQPPNTVSQAHQDLPVTPQAEEMKRRPSNASRSSISILMNTPEPPQSHPPRPLSRNTPPPPTEPPKKQTSPPQAAPSSLQKSVSPPSNLPAQGNFLQAHKRSKSTPDAENKKLALYRSLHSPGPANVALARGINLETGERNTNNARIAAAALAAAADIPLPLKIAVLQPPVAVKLETETSSTAEADREELTEPENDNKTDDDKTDDESISKKSLEQIIMEPQLPETAVSPPLESVAVPSEVSEIKQALPPPVIPTSATYQAPSLESYKVDPDSGLIGCVCGIEDDDGFTIQCDVCYRWQHCLCMGFMTSEEVPEDEYRCYYCDETKWGKFDPLACRDETLSRLDVDKSTIEDGDLTRNEEYIQQQQIHHQQRRQQGHDAQANAHAHLQEQSELEENTTNFKPELGAKRKLLNSDKSEKKRRVEREGTPNELRLSAASGDPQILPPSAPEVPPVPQDILPNVSNQLLEDGVTSESYQSIYFNLQSNDYKRPLIKAYFDRLGLDFNQSFLELPKGEQAKKEHLEVEIMSLSKFKSLKFSRKILPNLQKYYQESKINIIKKNKFNRTKIQVKPYSDNQKQKFNGISKLSLFISANSGDLLVIPRDTPIIEYLGEIDLFKNYVHDSVSQYSVWGTTKPKVLKTFLPAGTSNVDIVLDSRFVGNESRFIRKSCPFNANCRIKQVYIPETNTFRFLVVTSEEITLKSDSSDEELRLDWEWDPMHPILKLYGNNNSEKFENLDNLDKSALISCVDNLLHFTECGCSTSSNYPSCAIFKVKKATSYLLRSTRKASSISNINLTKSKEELIIPKRERDYISWNERLLERDNLIQLDLTVTREKFTPDVVEELNHAEEINETKDDSAGETRKSHLLFQVPSKQQLFLRNQELVRKFEQLRSQGESPNNDLLTSENESEPKEGEEPEYSALPIPIIPDMVVKIEKTINDQLQPIVKEVETKLLADFVPTTSDATATVSVEPNIDVTPVTNVPIPAVEKAPETITPFIDNSAVPSKQETEAKHDPPKIVKKLSFADYKKKMK